jgi:hypothetical protein
VAGIDDNRTMAKVGTAVFLRADLVIHLAGTPPTELQKLEQVETLAI